MGGAWCASWGRGLKRRGGSRPPARRPRRRPPLDPELFIKKKKQTKEEEDSHRTGTSQRDASVLSVFWVSEKVLGVDLENGESREEASLLLPLALSL